MSAAEIKDPRTRTVGRRCFIAHRILQAAAFAGLAVSIIFYLSQWSSLPDEPGIHFDSKGFDVYASKIYGFYPHLIILAVLAVNAVVSWLIISGRVRLGMKVTERGSELIIGAAVIALDLTALTVTVFFMFWSWCVAVQTPLQVFLGDFVFTGIGSVIVIAVGFQIITAGRYRLPSENEEPDGDDKNGRVLRFLLTGSTRKKEPGKYHVLFRTASWLILGMMLFIVAFTVERLPHNDIADNYHGLAYFANFDEYLPKWLVFLPFIVAVPFAVLFEVIGIVAKKKNALPLMVLADRLKLIFAVFGSYCAMVLDTEGALSVAFFAIFGVLCVLALAVYFRERSSR